MLEPLKEEIFVFPPSQQEVIFHDPLDNLLQSSEKVGFMLFTNTESGFRLDFELVFTKFLFPRESERKEQSNSHLISWLHWSFEIT